MPTLTRGRLSRGLDGADADGPDADGAIDGADRTDPRFRARRAAVRAERAATRRRWARRVLVGLTIVAAVYGVVRSPLLDVDDVVVRGADRTGPDAVAAAGGLTVGGALVDLREADSEARIEALPWVQSATVERSWWGTISVVLAERTPAAVAVDGERRMLVDTSGRVLAPAPVGDGATAELTVLEGTEMADPGGQLGTRFADAMSVAAVLTPGVRSRVTAVRVEPDGTLTLLLQNRATVRWGRADQIDAKLRSLTTILGQVDLVGLCTIDVRVPATVAVTRDC